MAIASERAPLTSLVMNTASYLIVCNYRRLNFEKPMFFPFQLQKTDQDLHEETKIHCIYC